MAVVYQPFLLEVLDNGTPVVIERGMGTFGDLHYYFQLVQWTFDGHLPYRDFWFEFPPVPIAIFSGIYALAQARGTVSYMTWATMTGLFFSAVDVGNLWLLRKLAFRLHGRAAGVVLPWGYAVLAAPVIFVWWTFEPVVVFAILLSLFWLLQKRESRSAFAVALGTLTKIVPILLLPTVWRFLPFRNAVRYTVLSTLVVGLVVGGLVVWGGEMAWASLAAQPQKASYQTVWALLDGNYHTGRFGDPESRFDAEAAAETLGNHPALPMWLRTLPFAGAGIFAFTRKMRHDERSIVAFFSLTLVLFFLWAQGWSPQWVLTLTPLLLLNFPDRTGILLCLVLAFASLVEYPGLFMRAGESGGEIAGNLLPTFAALIFLRTGVLLGIAVGLYRLLTSGVGREAA